MADLSSQFTLTPFYNPLLSSNHKHHSLLTKD